MYILLIVHIFHISEGQLDTKWQVSYSVGNDYIHIKLRSQAAVHPHGSLHLITALLNVIIFAQQNTIK